MKVILILSLLSLLFLSIYAEGCEDNQAKNYNDCKNYEVDEGDTCCFMKSEMSYNGNSATTGFCYALTQEEIKNIDQTEKKAEVAMEIPGIKITFDCHSNYLNVLFLALLFILF